MSERSPRSLAELFRDIAGRCPERTALVDGDTSLTYRDVERAAAALAGTLVDHGARRADSVGLIIDRTARTPVAMLAVLMLGAAYVPLDPAHPAERLRHVIDDASIEVAVGDDASLPPGVAARLHVVAPGTRADVVAADRADPADRWPAADPQDTAYVLYTSGSTGTPKGCQVTHANVLALLVALAPLVRTGPDDRWSLFHSAAFDVSVSELWTAWSTGATAVVVPTAAAQSPRELLALLTRQRVSVLSLVPSVFTQLVRAYVDADRDGPTRPDLSLRCLLLAGEAVQLDVVAAFLDRVVAPPRVFNLYGPTETTVYATFKELGRADLSGPVASPIGRELPHLRIVLRDADGRPVRCGDTGEIWIHGAGVARGYLNRPELTAEHFRVPGEGAGEGADDRKRGLGVGYRSGDLARRLPDGELEYLGRVDQQVKLRGFRIELGEIEAALRADPGVHEVAVLVLGDDPERHLLLALYVPADRAAIPRDAQLRATARRVLPAYMVPQRFEAVAALPHTSSGKLDRAALARAVAARSATAG